MKPALQRDLNPMAKPSLSQQADSAPLGTRFRYKIVNITNLGNISFFLGI